MGDRRGDPGGRSLQIIEMTDCILVAYASALGSTAEVASAIGETLVERGFSVDVRSVVERPQVNGYQAVIIGSAVRYATWLPEAIDFVKDNWSALNSLPVALFSVHIQNLGNDDRSRKKRLAYLDAVRPFLPPAAEAFFAGRLDRDGSALLMPRWFARFVPPVDFRNWDTIHAWAQKVFV
jgi:menaquinone-dependent protoporphyrinogen oxidase